jgi:hypothetical protein
VSDGPGRFLDSIDGARTANPSELVGLFAYYLTVEAGQISVTVSSIDDCFRRCDLTPPTRTARILSEGVQSRPQKFVKLDKGYKLQKYYREELSRRLGGERVMPDASAELRKLETKFPDGSKKEFLRETVACFEAGAYRAAIVMCWIFAMDHLYDVVLTGHLSSFNGALAKVTDGRVKVSVIRVRDDFIDIPEGKFIELLRSSGVISNDVRKILDSKLAIRNSSAHPSGVTIKRSKAIDFIEDLVENVVLKYPT